MSPFFRVQVINYMSKKKTNHITVTTAKGTVKKTQLNFIQFRLSMLEKVWKFVQSLLSNQSTVNFTPDLVNLPI